MCHKTISLFFFFLLCFLMTNCSVEGVIHNGDKDTYEKVSFIQEKGNALFFDNETRQFYLIQAEEELHLGIVNSVLVEDRGIVLISDQGEILLSVLPVNERNSMQVQGISIFSGPSAEDELLVSKQKIHLGAEIDVLNPNLLINDVVGGVKCKCRKEGRSDKVCDSGGVGASECSIAVDGNVKDKCEVECDVSTGYYVCCRI